MDTYFFFQVRKLIGRHTSLDRLMIHIAKYGPLWFFAVMGLSMLSEGGAGLRASLTAVLAATLTRGLNELLGRLHHRDRPFIRERFTPLLPHRPSSSFPSNHAACGFALAVSLYLPLPSFGLPLLALATLLSFSRVYIGVHYPSDVTFGALIGCGVASLLHTGLTSLL